MIEILATISASAAAGMRVGVPLLLIGLWQGSQVWSGFPVLCRISPSVLLGLLVVWSLIEVFASKKLLGQRLIQIVELCFSPVVGAIMALAVTSITIAPSWLIAFIGGLLALVLQLVQVGWFYRLRGLPLWAVFLQDILCVMLVMFAFYAPGTGGFISLILLWFAVLSAKKWYKWYWRR